MNSIIMPLVLCAVGAPGEPVAPKVPIDKETTYVTEPVDKDGFIDYEKALSERLSKGIKPETNANVLLWKLLGPKPEGGIGMPPDYFKYLGIEEPPEKGNYFVSLGAYRDRLKLVPEELEELLDQQGRASARPWKAADMPYITGWLVLNEKPLALAVEASKRPHYFNPLVSHKPDKEPGCLINALLPHVQKCREVISALNARAMQKVAMGKVDEAWQDLLVCHRLARHLGQGPTLIESLVSIATDAMTVNADLAFLENAKLNPQQLRACLKDLQELPPFPKMADKLDLCERFVYLDCVQLIRRGNVKMLRGLADLPAPKDAEKEAKALALIDWAPVYRSGNQWYDRMVQALRNKDREARGKELERIEMDLKGLKNEHEKLIKVLEQGNVNEAVSKAIANVMIGLLMPAVRKLEGSTGRAEQLQRNLQIAFAMESYRRANRVYPTKLDDLAPKHLTAVPNDVFSGKPLIYQPSADGYLLYSIGINGKDDEGRWYDDDPPGDDPRVRMPLPELKPRKRD